jgi:hypothetical protein
MGDGIENRGFLYLKSLQKNMVPDKKKKGWLKFDADFLVGRMMVDRKGHYIDTLTFGRVRIPVRNENEKTMAKPAYGYLELELWENDTTIAVIIANDIVGLRFEEWELQEDKNWAKEEKEGEL